MSTTHTKSRFRDRSTRMETRVDTRLYDAIDTFAVEHGYTLSSALYKILLDWERSQRRKAIRKKIEA